MSGPVWEHIPVPAKTVLGTIESEASAYYNASSEEPLGQWTETPHTGACDLNTGRCSDDDFPDNGRWKQV